MKTLGLEHLPDEGQLEACCREALVGKDKVVADVKAGTAQALNALLGPVMKASKGTANPERVKAILQRLVGSS